MANENNYVKRGIGKIDTINGDIYFDSQIINNKLDIDDLVNQISDKVNQPIIELQTKDKEIELLKKIISELKGSNKDEKITQYLEAGDYIEAAHLMEKSLNESSDKLFDDEIRFIETISLYSFNKAIEIIEKKLNKYQDENIYIARLTLTYADILLRTGKHDKALKKYASAKKFPKYKLHFLKSEKNYITVGLTKSDGTQIDDIHNFNFKDKNIQLEVMLSAQVLFFANKGTADCLNSNGFYGQARSMYFKALRYAIFLQDNEFIEAMYSFIAYMYYAEGNYIEALSFFNRIGDDSHEAPFKYQILMHIYASQNNMIKLEEIKKKNRNIYSAYNGKKKSYYEAGYYESLGVFYLKNEEYSNAEIYFLKSIEAHKEKNQIKAMLDVYKQIAYLYQLQGDTEKEKYYYEQTIELSKKHQFYSTLSNAIHNYALSEEDKSKRIEKFKEALSINKKIDKKLSIATNLSMLADSYRNLKNFKRAKKYIENSYRILQKENQTKMMNYDAYYNILSLDKKELKGYFYLLKISGRCDNCYKKYDAYINLGEYCIKNDNIKMALKSFLKAEENLHKCKLCKDTDKFDTYIYLSQIYFNMDNLKKLNHYKKIASKYAIEKNQKLSIELLDMTLAIKKRDIKKVLNIADNISMNFLEMQKVSISSFFHTISPILMNPKLHEHGKKYADRYIDTVKNDNTQNLDQEDAIILSYVGNLYTISFFEIRYLDLWSKATAYSQLSNNFFVNHIKDNKENYFHCVITFFRLGVLFFVVEDIEKSTVIYDFIFNSNFISDETWKDEKFKLNIELYYGGMVNYANVLRLNKEYDKAIEISNKNIKLLEKTTDLKHLELAISNLGLTYEETKEYKKAMLCHKDALEYAVLSKNTYAIAHAYEHIGINYNNLKNAKEAIFHLEKAIYSYKKISNADDIERVRKLKQIIRKNDA